MKPAGRSSAQPRPRATVQDVLARLERLGKPAVVADMARYGITAERAFGVTVGQLKSLSKEIGLDHALALELWKSGWYEARMLAAFVGEPDKLTASQMDAWARDFDSWAVVDHACFHLFDRSPHAWKKARAWMKAKPEFRRRAGFALLWALSLHDKKADDAAFRACLPDLESGAADGRHFVGKAVDMALRAVGKRSAALRVAAVRLAERLAEADDAASRAIGKHVLRELDATAVKQRLRAASARRKKT